MIDLESLKTRLAETPRPWFWTPDGGIAEQQFDLGAVLDELEHLRAEVAHLRKTQEIRMAHMWRVHEAVSAHQRALHDRARPEDLAMWEATYDEP
jgi:hypothetical protein